MVMELRCYAMKCAGGSSALGRIWFPGLVKLGSVGKKECLEEWTKAIAERWQGIAQVSGYGQGTDGPGTLPWQGRHHCLKSGVVGEEYPSSVPVLLSRACVATLCLTGICVEDCINPLPHTQELLTRTTRRESWTKPGWAATNDLSQTIW